MKKIISIFIALMAMVSASHASWVIFVNTNSLGQPDTNTFLLQSISTPIQANGRWFETGVALRARPNTNGIFSTNLSMGNWIASNAFLANPNNLGGAGSTLGVIIAVPPGDGTNYAAALVISGANTYNYRLGTITGTNGVTATLADTNNWVIGLSGTNGVNSLAQGTNVSVQNAGGGALTVNADVSHSEVSNSVFVASNSISGRLTALTNAFTPIVFSNPSAFYLNSNPSNYVTSAIISGLASTNYVVAATTSLGSSLTALVNAATNSVLTQAAAFTNGLPTTATLNTASNALRGLTVNATNDLNTTLRALITTTSNGAVSTAVTFTNGLVNTAGLNTASNALVSSISSSSNTVFGQARTMTNDLNANIRVVLTNHVNYVSNSLVGSYTTAINAASNSLAGQIGTGGGGGVSTNYVQGATNTAVVGALTITTNNINTVSNFLRAFTVTATNDLNTSVGTLVTAATNAARTGILTTTTNFVINTSNSLFTSIISGDQSASNSLFTALVASTNVLLNGGVSNLVNATSNGLMGRISASTSAQWTATLATSNSLAGNITTLNTQTNYLAKTNDARPLYLTNNANQLGIVTVGGITNTGSSRLSGDVVALGNITVAGGVAASSVSGTHTGNGAGLTTLDASQLSSGTVPLAVLSGIRSNNIDANTWLLATNNVNALSVVSGVSNAFVAWTNGQMFGTPEFVTQSGSTTNHYYWQNNGTNLVFNWYKNVGAVNTTQAPPMMTFDQGGNIYIGSTLVGSGASLTNINPLNLSAGLITNQDIYFGLDAGTVQNTNYVEVRGGGSTTANSGLYYWDSMMQYTNANTGYMLSNNGSVWVVKNASAAALYTFPTIPSTNGTIAGGSAPAPALSYGASYRVDGDAFEGWLNVKGPATFSSNAYFGSAVISNLFVTSVSMTNLTLQNLTNNDHAQFNGQVNMAGTLKASSIVGASDITSDFFIGDGSQITGISGTNVSLADVNNSGVISSNQFVGLEQATKHEFHLLLPPAGWDTWYGNGANISETIISNTLNDFDSMNIKSIWPNFYVMLNDGWQRTNGAQPIATLEEDTNKFPRRFTNLTAMVHSRGYKIILYTEPRSVTSAGGGVGSGIGTNIEGGMKWMADRGFDGVRFDLVGVGDRTEDRIQLIKRMMTSFSRYYTNGQPTFYSSVGPITNANDLALFPEGMLLRFTEPNGPTDWGDEGLPYFGVHTNFLRRLQLYMDYGVWDYQTPSRWLQSDLIINGFPIDSIATEVAGMWCMLGASAWCSASFSYESNQSLTNRELMSLMQDPAQFVARPVITNSSSMVWVKMLANGDRAVALINRATNTTTTANIGFSFAQAWLNGANPAYVRDLVAKTNLYVTSGVFTSAVAGSSTRFFRITPDRNMPISGDFDQVKVHRQDYSFGDLDSLTHGGYGDDGIGQPISYQNTAGTAWQAKIRVPAWATNATLILWVSSSLGNSSCSNFVREVSYDTGSQSFGGLTNVTQVVGTIRTNCTFTTVVLSSATNRFLLFGNSVRTNFNFQVYDPVQVIFQ